MDCIDTSVALVDAAHFAVRLLTGNPSFRVQFFVEEDGEERGPDSNVNVKWTILLPTGFTGP
jgi:hypothetical protein